MTDIKRKVSEVGCGIVGGGFSVIKTKLNFHIINKNCDKNV